MDNTPHLGDQFPTINGKPVGFSEEEDASLQQTVKKPWGSYTDHYRTDKVVFKLINVNPNSQLSLQSHEHRQEVWVVLEGECNCVLDQEVHQARCDPRVRSVKKLKEGDYIFIPTNSKHRLSNESETVCTVAEMQFGKCSEGDITRYQDDYNRK